MRPCRQCFIDYEPSADDDGFCSDSCMRQYDAELVPEPKPLPGGERRTDHRAYSVECPSCNAAPWRACVGTGVAKRGEALAKPHLARVKSENARGPEPEVRTAQDEGTVGAVEMHFGVELSGDAPR